MSSYSTVAVIGLGKVGYPAACCFSDMGYRVLGCDTSTELVEALQKGENPLPWEPDVDPRKLTATLSLDRAIKEADVAYIIVPTPMERRALSSKYVDQVLRGLSDLKWRGLTIVASTLDPRDAARVVSGDNTVYCPPLIRLGSVVEDLKYAKLGLLGVNSQEGANKTYAFWKWRSQATNLTTVIESDPTTIAVTKLAINTSLSLRIGWANEIAGVAENCGADVDTVLNAVQSDPRIGRGYFQRGHSPAGACLPRDLDMWSLLGRTRIADMLRDSHYENDAVIIDQVVAMLVEQQHENIAVLGITYNPRALDITNSQGVAVARALQRVGAAVKVYDPASSWFSEHILDLAVCKTAEEALVDVTAVVVSTPWPEFLHMDFGSRFVVDLRRKK